MQSHGNHKENTYRKHTKQMRKESKCVTTKLNRTQNKMANVGASLLVITLNINGLNYPSKIQIDRWIKQS